MYVDAIINHMSGAWPKGTPSSGSSEFNGESESYPGVPYTSSNFNDKKCHTLTGNIEDFQDPNQVNTLFVII